MWNIMNKLNQQTEQRDSQRAGWQLEGGERLGEEGLSKTEKGLMDYSVVIVGGGKHGYKGLNDNGKITIKIFFKRDKLL